MFDVRRSTFTEWFTRILYRKPQSSKDFRPADLPFVGLVSFVCGCAALCNRDLTTQTVTSLTSRAFADRRTRAAPREGCVVPLTVFRRRTRLPWSLARHCSEVRVDAPFTFNLNWRQ
jgi:hypothetical protein